MCETSQNASDVLDMLGRIISQQRHVRAKCATAFDFHRHMRFKFILLESEFFSYHLQHRVDRRRRSKERFASGTDTRL
jgi:hypothetical protein